MISQITCISAKRMQQYVLNVFWTCTKSLAIHTISFHGNGHHQVFHKNLLSNSA